MESQETGKEIYELIEELYPICRSITGEGVRQSRGILRRLIPVEVHEVLMSGPKRAWFDDAFVLRPTEKLGRASCPGRNGLVTG